MRGYICADIQLFDLEWGCTKTVVLCVQTDLTAKVSSTHPNLGHKPVHVISKEKRRIYDKLGFYSINDISKDIKCHQANHLMSL